MPTAQYAQEKKDEVLKVFSECGSFAKTAKLCNVPTTTVKSWSKTDWWKDAIKGNQQEDMSKLDVQLSKAIDVAIANVIDRLQKGDEVYNSATGKTVRIPVKLRDANHALSTLVDKRQLVRNQPTKIVEQNSTAMQLQNLANQFREFVTGKKKSEKFEELVDQVIEGETVELQPDGSYAVKQTNTEDIIDVV